MSFGALKCFPALVVGFKNKLADSPGYMLNPYNLKSVWNTGFRERFTDNGISGNKTSSDIIDRPKQLELYNVPGRFAGITSSPGIDRMVKAPALPPVRIKPGKVQGKFVASDAFRLSDSISRQKKSFTVDCTIAKKLKVLDIKLSP